MAGAFEKRLNIHRVAVLLGERGAARRSFWIDDIVVEHDRIDFRINSKGVDPARLRVGLPHSGDAQYWLYIRPDNSADWVGQLLLWIEEEVETGGLRASRVREDRGGASYVVVEPYGWRLSSPSEHQRRLSAAGPDGWHGPYSDLMRSAGPE